MKRIVGLLLVISFIFFGCTSKSDLIKEFDYVYFDTPINIKIYYSEDDNFDFEKMDEDIKNIFTNMEQEFDTTKKDSTVSKLNSGGKLKVSDDFVTVLNKSLQGCNLTNGRYDPTSGTLIELWSINNKNHLATKKEITKAQKSIGCQRVVEEGNVVTIPKGYLLDFGSIVKGYTADRLEEYLNDKGVYSALLNLGGNIQTIGKKENITPFKIGILKPEIENITNENVILLDSEDQAIVTSGINQRYFEKDGIIYHHILDAIEGYPVDNNLASVTIITDNGTDADLLSTAIFIMGLEEGYNYIENLADYEAIFITQDKEIYFTSGIKDYEILDSNYSVKTL